MSPKPEIANIDEALVRRLVSSQFPAWAALPITSVERQGHDNRTVRLGEGMSVRLPSGPAYAAHLAVEHHWLPRLAPQLPVAIPESLAMGDPGHGYPWHWTINRWLAGEDAAAKPVGDLVLVARDLAGFLTAIQAIDVRDGPIPSVANFFRGGHLSVYGAEVAHCMDRLEKVIDARAAAELWERAVSSQWDQTPVWVHGDFAAPNLLIEDGRLSGVIDFGQLAVGDPACDVTIAWTFLRGKSRRVLRDRLDPDEATWLRGRGWALWKALLTLDEHRVGRSTMRESAEREIREILAEDD